ncbi:MAG: hypothetical protein JSU81_06835 [Candidatus Coatesbacteria bacterium]|nr:MAG: hypothetical protein JSU81_06835 [Candidatus Coatesbacteria bacterium]
MKRFSLTATAAAVLLPLLAGASGEKLWEERFEGTAFPPPGWQKLGTGAWDWTRETEGLNHFAYGFAFAAYGTSSESELRSKTFSLESGQQLFITFRYKGVTSGAPINYSRIVGLYAPNLTCWEAALPPYASWVTYRGPTAEVPATRDDYYFAWVLKTSSNPSGPGGLINASVDVVVVERRFPAVGPTSLGRVKALYR